MSTSVLKPDTAINQYSKLLDKQHRFFRRGETRPIHLRIQYLNKLKKIIQKHEDELLKALFKDLRKSEIEAFSTEVGLIYMEITHMVKHLKKWAKKKKVKSDVHTMPAKSYIQKEPYGQVLIIAPWNYPFQLLFAPFLGALAAGNTVILKPSEFAPHVAEAAEKIIKETFSPEHVAIVQGGVPETTALLDLPVDKIFFTGSVPVGKIVMQAAAKRLTPVTLELGGKSPVIVDETANMKVAAKKIVWGKFLNAGQTCVAPDYALVHHSVKNEFIKAVSGAITEFYTTNPQECSAFSRIINRKQFDRLITLIDHDKVVFGGNKDCDDLYIEPTIMDTITWDDPVMADEIFGPILPVLTYTDIEDAIDQVNNHPKPLALYVFTTNKKTEKQITEHISFGGGGINTAVMQVASLHLPFGGVGSSGVGAYHGKASFDIFSHSKSIMKQHSHIDPGIAYPTHKMNNLKMLKLIMK